MTKILETVQEYILLAIVFLLPLFVSTAFTNFLEFPKLVLLSFGVSLAVLAKAIITLRKGEFKIGTSPIDFPLLLLAVSYIISALLRTPNKMEAFLFPGTATAIISLILLYFLLNATATKEKISTLLFFSGALVSLVSIFTYFNVFSAIPQLPAFLRSPQFSLFEGKLPEAIFLATIIPFGVQIVLREKTPIKKTVAALSMILVAGSLALSVFNMLPGKSATPALASFQTSWSVSVDALKETPVLGVGPGNYLTAFNRFRPFTYNSTDMWGVRFTTARNWPFTLLTEVGLLGFAAFLLIAFKVFKMVRSLFKERVGYQLGRNELPLVSLALISVLLLLFPANLSLLFVLFVVLAINMKVEPVAIQLSAFMYSQSSTKSSKAPSFLIAAPALVLVVLFLGFGSRAVYAENKFKQALDAAATNDGRLTYDLMREAITLNPYVDRYHASYTQINLALANVIAQNENITEEDRNIIAQLIQQAIREAKTTVLLNQFRAGNWELLGQTYQSIIAFAEGADQFALESYSQAIALDPYNPNLRIALGGVLYAQGRYDDAIRAFELAVVAKNDLANAHYNLAVALREKGDTQNAANAMRNTLALLTPGTADYDLARNELNRLENASQAGTQPTAGENLTPPTEVEPVLTPPLDLPEDSSPPETVVEPEE